MRTIWKGRVCEGRGGLLGRMVEGIRGLSKSLRTASGSF